MNGRRNGFWDWVARLRDLDRRWVYLMTFVVLSVLFIAELLHKHYPRFPEVVLTPAVFSQAEKIFDYVEQLADIPEGEGSDRAVIVSFDWGPQTKAELEPISRALLKHLFYRRVPVIVVTMYRLGGPMIRHVPQDVAKTLVKVDEQGKPIKVTLRRDEAGEEITYGKHWLNLGYQPGWEDAIRALASDLRQAAPKDAEQDKPVDTFPVMSGIHSAEDFALMVEVTGLVGAFDAWLQWFKKKREPMRFGLGCTSISIPESYAYIDSGQLEGLFEGVAGAAAYERLLRERFGLQPSPGAYSAMTAQIFGQGLIILLVIVGNVAWFASRKRQGGRQ